ncbi:MAG: MATE family efflux transporter [Treponemataceae bacterium]|nr:MATE family efflux transporter [Treponemataceae bacterium]
MEKSIQQENELAVKPIGKLVTKFAIPSVVSLTVTALYNIVDQIFIGNNIGYVGNGATNVVFPITVIAHGLAMLFGCGCAAFMNLCLGREENEKANKGVGNTLSVLILLCVLIPTVCEIFISPLVNLFGSTADIYPYAIEYGRIIIAGFPFVIMYTGFNQIIRADGNPKMAMVSMFSGAIINVILDASFMYGLNWGIKGAAWATIIGQGVSFVISLVYIFKLKNIKLNKKSFLIDWRVLGRLSAIGVSSFITQAEIVLLSAVMNNTLKKYGANSVYGDTIPQTAIGIVMKVNSVLINIISGIAIGGQPIISFNYGAKNYDRVKKTFWILTVAALIVSGIAFLLFQIFPRQISGIFGNDSELYTQFAVMGFRIYLMFCILIAFQTVAGVFIQSVGKPLMSSILSLARQVVFLIPLIILFGYLWGVEGPLWAGPVADGLAFIMAVAFVEIECKKMKKNKTTEKVNNQAEQTETNQISED